ncbi:MAG TPA: cell envelope integrity protein CreD [Cyclobacteriaceae bacterium]|jgi:inner membrane protein|nr:cell envelope integrity protein CreD [Cyclobacteriaceae bacterium]
METKENQLNLFERFNRWMQESITVKLVSIGFLVLILLIPSSWIQELMQERQSRAESVTQEISAKWSGNQTLSGPILVIPYKVKKKIDHGKEGIEIQEYIEKLFLLPQTLDIRGEIDPTVLHRGIFDAAVYSSTLNVNSSFDKPDFQSFKIAEDMVLWRDAHMIFSITDLRGISENPQFAIGGLPKESEPSNALGVAVKKFIGDFPSPYPLTGGESDANFSTNGIVAKLNWQSEADFNGNASIKINLKGSTRLFFTPTGKTTTVQLSGPWPSPGFDGEFLPESRQLSEKNFSAKWKVLHYNRPFAQAWTDPDTKLSGSEFGVKLIIPVDQYQKSIRTSKYGHLVIILTFVALFLVEITKKIRIHPFQYILIAAALIIYYTLLLSLSEQVGYNLAYGISSIATVALICLYSFSFLKNKSLVMLFTSLLLVFYSFIFIIVLQQDLSLLLGSIGLFIIVGALMYFARKVNWYGEPAAE